MQSNFEDSNNDWMDVLSGIFTLLLYGFAPHELVYKRRFGDQPGTGEDGEPLPSSNFNDGRIGWHRWGLRA